MSVPSKSVRRHLTSLARVLLLFSAALNVVALASLFDGTVTWVKFFSDIILIYRITIRIPLSQALLAIWPAGWPLPPMWMYDFFVIWSGFFLAYNIVDYENRGKTELFGVFSAIRTSKWYSQIKESIRNSINRRGLVGLLFGAAVMVFLVIAIFILFLAYYLLVPFLFLASAVSKQERAGEHFYATLAYLIYLFLIFIVLLFINFLIQLVTYGF